MLKIFFKDLSLLFCFIAAEENAIIPCELVYFLSPLFMFIEVEILRSIVRLAVAVAFY